MPDAIVAADLDETPLPQETPRLHALRLAQAKADHVAQAHPGALVLAADTVVSVGRRLLPKAEARDQADACLRLLSGRNHRVTTAIAVHIAPANPGGLHRKASRAVETRLSFKRLSTTEITAYLDTGEWAGKAGGYGIQGRAGAFCTRLVGSWEGVMGLPLYDTKCLLEGLGWTGAQR